MDEPTAFTVGVWKVKPGNQDAFIEAWEEIGEVFLKLENPPLWGKLVQSELDPTQFYSFGPWDDAGHVALMRQDDASMAAIQKAASLCDEATPTPCTLRAAADR